MRRFIVIPLVAASLFAAGCSQQRTAADKSLDSIEASLNEIKADASRYAPEGLKGVESNLKRLKASYDNKEYDNVVAGTPQLQKAVASLKLAVDNGKKHAVAASAVAKREWNALNEEVPKLVESIDTRVKELSERKRLPLGISKDEFEGSKAGLESMKSLWAEAKRDFNAGRQTAAATKAKTVKGMAEQVRDQLNIKEEIHASRG